MEYNNRQGVTWGPSSVRDMGRLSTNSLECLCSGCGMSGAWGPAPGVIMFYWVVWGPVCTPSKPDTCACICRPRTCTARHSSTCRWLTGGWKDDVTCCLATALCQDLMGPGRRLGFGGNVEAVWLSDRHRSQRTIDLALPVNALLYRQEFSTDQFKSFLAPTSCLYCL